MAAQPSERTPLLQSAPASEIVAATPSYSHHDAHTATIVASYVKDALQVQCLSKMQTFLVSTLMLCVEIQKQAKVTDHLRDQSGRSERALAMYDLLFFHPLVKNAMVLVAWLHMSLVFFEPPYVTGSSWPLLPFPLSQCAELFFLSVYALHLYLRNVACEVCARGVILAVSNCRFHVQVRGQTIQKTGAVILMCMADTAVSIVWPAHFRFARLFRPYFFFRQSRLLKVRESLVLSFGRLFHQDEHTTRTNTHKHSLAHTHTHSLALAQEAFENLLIVLALTWPFLLMTALFVCVAAAFFFTALNKIDSENFGTLPKTLLNCLVLLTTCTYWYLFMLCCLFCSSVCVFSCAFESIFCCRACVCVCVA